MFFRNNSDIIEKVPSDAKKVDINLLIKETIKKNDTKFSSKTIKIKKENNKRMNKDKEDNLSRTHSGAEKIRNNTNDFYKENEKMRPHSSHKITTLNYMRKKIGMIKNNSEKKNFLAFNSSNIPYINKDYKINTKIIFEKYSTNTETNKKSKLNKNLTNNLEYNKNNKNYNNSKKNSKCKTKDNIKTKRNNQQTKTSKSSSKNQDIIKKKHGNKIRNMDDDDDACIVF